jgi:hypothetical protein
MSASTARHRHVPAARPDVPSVGDRLGIAQRKLALVKSAAVNFQKRGESDVNSKDLIAGLIAELDAALVEVFRVTESEPLQALLDAPAPGDLDPLDQAGSALIERAEALLARDRAQRPAGAADWNDEWFVLETVFRARREIGDFEKLHAEIRALNGIVELVYHALAQIPDHRDSPVHIDVVRAAVNDARERFGAIYSTTGTLAELDSNERREHRDCAAS